MSTLSTIAGSSTRARRLVLADGAMNSIPVSLTVQK